MSWQQKSESAKCIVRYSVVIAQTPINKTRHQCNFRPATWRCIGRRRASRGFPWQDCNRLSRDNVRCAILSLFSVSQNWFSLWFLHPDINRLKRGRADCLKLPQQGPAQHTLKEAGRLGLHTSIMEIGAVKITSSVYWRAERHQSLAPVLVRNSLVFPRKTIISTGFYGAAPRRVSTSSGLKIRLPQKWVKSGLLGANVGANGTQLSWIRGFFVEAPKPDSGPFSGRFGSDSGGLPSRSSDFRLVTLTFGPESESFRWKFTPKSFLRVLQ